MTKLKPHECTVIEALTKNLLSENVIKSVKENGEVVDYKITGNGYFLIIRHSELPASRLVCAEPVLIGECNGIQTGFVIFIENHELTFECHGWGDREISGDYREGNIIIRKA